MYGCFSQAPQLGTWPATQACALNGNWTADLLVCSPALKPLSYMSQGLCCVSKTNRWNGAEGSPFLIQTGTICRQGTSHGGISNKFRRQLWIQLKQETVNRSSLRIIRKDFIESVVLLWVKGKTHTKGHLSPRRCFRR